MAAEIAYALSTSPIEVHAAYDAVRRPGAGGVALFVGAVRDTDGGRPVVGLGYSAHPTAEGVLRDVVHEVLDGQPVHSAIALHRLGDLVVGDLALVVAVACSHRAEAFPLCERLVEQIKARVPIWKHQTYVDGTDEWVGAPL